MPICIGMIPRFCTRLIPVQVSSSQLNRLLGFRPCRGAHNNCDSVLYQRMRIPVYVPYTACANTHTRPVRVSHRYMHKDVLYDTYHLKKIRDTNPLLQGRNLQSEMECFELGIMPQRQDKNLQNRAKCAIPRRNVEAHPASNSFYVSFNKVDCVRINCSARCYSQG